MHFASTKHLETEADTRSSKYSGTISSGAYCLEAMTVLPQCYCLLLYITAEIPPLLIEQLYALYIAQHYRSKEGQHSGAHKDHSMIAETKVEKCGDETELVSPCRPQRMRLQPRRQVIRAESWHSSR